MTSSPAPSRTRNARRLCTVLLGAAVLLVGCGGSPDDAPVSYAPTELSTAGQPPPADPETESASAETSPAASTTGTAESSTSTDGCEIEPCYLPPVDLGYLTDDLAPEASGIAPSGIDPNLFFTIDDAANTDRIVAIDGSGLTRATITVADLNARNAEALSPGVCADLVQRCLYIGDIGDNGLRRETITVYRIAEPVVPTGEVTELGPVPSEVWEFSYPDGPRNAESMMIADDGSVIIVTKPDGGTSPHEIFRGPAGGGELLFVNSFTPPKALTPVQSILIGTVATDISRLPDRVLLLTYDQAIEYLAPTPGADPATFSEWPFRQLEIPGQWQSEGVTYLGAAGLPECGFVVISEKGGGGQAQLGEVGCAT